MSITQSQNATNNSPSTRSAGRRRDSGADLLQPSNPVTSPSGNSRFSKEDFGISSPPTSLLRRKTDHKEALGQAQEEKEKDSGKQNTDSAMPFGSLKRTNTNPLSAGLNNPSSPWSGAPPSAGFSPMGAFGNFGAVDTPTSAEKRPGYGSVRGESRFKGLMGAGSSENMGSKVREKASLNNLDRLTESTNDQSSSRWGPGRPSQASREDIEQYGDDDHVAAGSAALGGDDASPPIPQSSRFRNPDRQTSYDDIGFASLGVSSDMPPFREMMQRRDYSQQQTPQRNQGMGQTHEPMSPTSTNPYQSPEGEKVMPDDNDTDDSDLHNMQYPGAGSFGQAARGFSNQFDVNDRSQTTSRGLPNLGGLGNLSGLGGPGAWSAAPGAIGTPSRAQPGFSAGFGDSSLGALGDLNSPHHNGLGSANFTGSGVPASNTGTIGRGSKLQSLFSNAMQDQMRGESVRQESGFGDAPGFASVRDMDSQPHLGRGGIDDLFGSGEGRLRGLQGLPSPFPNETIQPPASASAQTTFSAGPSGSNYFARSQDPDTSAASNQMPASQQRQMVMPDRMRWIYRDPQGNTQGPWSGLEMHDWYKAGFFSPELQVKKLEDTDYEPLAQLIRRIGNSREPFLVPQIGIPHGSLTVIPSTSTVVAPATTPSVAPSSSAQPPFANSFPSFGTTLTAEQQNALERRKQEEQYLMARQKEHLAQQQVLLKQMHQMQGGIHGQQLHHHSSAHSLQSQPSYGSITSPTGYQPSPAQGPIQPPSSVPGFFDAPTRNGGPLGADALSSVREEDLPGFMERLNMGRSGQPPFGSSSYNQDHHQQINAMLQDRSRLQRDQEQYDLIQRGADDPRGTAERLEQYHQLRAQEEEQQQFQQRGPIGGHGGRQIVQQQGQEFNAHYQDQLQHSIDRRTNEPLSLSEQVQQAAAKKPSAVAPQSPWAKVESGAPQPFPPPQSASPMPAPTPQRNRQSVADALNAESQSPSQLDSAETPSAVIAPWAKETLEGSKGPSLKEIQAMEARKAAQQEDIAAAARRAIVEQERLNHQNQPVVAPAPGLPSSANWASSVSPAIPVSTGASAWAKPAVGKPTVATPVSGAKKTLAQIQKEEEARKNRAAAAAATNTANVASAVAATAGGKRYADLASKAALAMPQTSNTAWTTVGASGKVKTPVTPAPSLSTRTASGGIVQPSASATKPKITSSTTMKTNSNQQNANDEFQKWTKGALSKGLHPSIPGKPFSHGPLTSCPIVPLH